MDNNLSGLGGFPKIYKCDKAELQIIQESKNREFATVKSTVSIKDIMLKRKEKINIPNI
jgi:hypothetical protein